MTTPLRPTVARRQRGVVLFVALIVLVSLTLAGLAVMRTIEGGLLVTSNLVFKQAALASADRGVEAGRNWVLAPGVNRNNDDVAQGYYSSSGPVDPANPTAWGVFDPLKFDWAAGARLIGTDISGNTVHMVIHRMCKVPNVSVDSVAPVQSCIKRGADTVSGVTPGQSAAAGGTEKNLTAVAAPYYRITTRATGPKNSVAYVQTIID